jgi:hypothetical protein
VFLATTTWYEDVSGVSRGFSVFPVTIQVNGAALTVTNSSPSNLFKFLVKAHVTASEGAFSASADVDYRVQSEEFRFEQAYYDALKACWDRIMSLTHRALKRVLPIGPGDPAWVWEGSLSPWVESDRLAKIAEVASSCAAIQRPNPTLAHELRTQAAVIGRVPVGDLMPTQVSRGVLR